MNRPISDRAVVVTGCSSGIGRATAIRLAGIGFQVHASVRKGSDADALVTEHPTIKTLILDIADPASVRAAGETLSRECPDGIDGLVNNAGIAVAGPTEWLQRDDWRSQYEVNVFGTVDLTRTLLPLVRRRSGRIVNVGSAASSLALPLIGPYASSKFALDGFNDSLRRELASLGVKVVMIVPGQTATGIFDKSEQQVESSMNARGTDPVLDHMMARLQTLMHQSESSRRPTSRVAAAIEKALTAKRPKRRYYVGWDAHGSRIVRSIIPDAITDWIIARKLSSPERL